MKRYKITYNYFLDTQCTKKRIAIKILEAYDKEHAIQLIISTILLLSFVF